MTSMFSEVTFKTPKKIQFSDFILTSYADGSRMPIIVSSLDGEDIEFTFENVMGEDNWFRNNIHRCFSGFDDAEVGNIDTVVLKKIREKYPKYGLSLLDLKSGGIYLYEISELKVNRFRIKGMESWWGYADESTSKLIPYAEIYFDKGLYEKEFKIEVSLRELTYMVGYLNDPKLNELLAIFNDPSLMFVYPMDTYGIKLSSEDSEFMTSFKEVKTVKDCHELNVDTINGLILRTNSTIYFFDGETIEVGEFE